MKDYANIVEAAETINERWHQSKSIDWDQAESLANLMLAWIEPDHLTELPRIQAILKYAQAFKEWDSAIVASWPEEILEDLRSSAYRYVYFRADGEWRVRRMNLAGEEEWVADVETEKVAELLVRSLQPEPEPEPSNPDYETELEPENRSYKVSVQRIATSKEKVIQVAAESTRKAEEIALGYVGDLEFDTDEARYEVTGVTPSDNPSVPVKRIDLTIGRW